MKRAIKMSLLGLLTMGMFASCNPEKEENENPQEDERSYTETALGLDMRMVYVEGGIFEMGATAEQADDTRNNEKPVRTVKVDSYYIGKYEVTQAQWEAVMGTTLEEQRAMSSSVNGIVGEGSDFPMYYVSWADAQAFCEKLSEQTGRKYVLPTEAQWEYAARGGHKSKHFKYSGSNNLDNVAWYMENSQEQPHRVGTKRSNELGICDMSGNVWEWCSDWYSSYKEDDTDNPQGPADGVRRVVRGGSWGMVAEGCRVSYRGSDSFPDSRFNHLGFRVAVLL